MALTPPGPNRRAALRQTAVVRQDSLTFWTGLANRYGDVFAVPLPRTSQVLVVSRPELAAHVLVSNQDKYLKACRYRPLAELLGNGLLTNEGAGRTRKASTPGGS